MTRLYPELGYLTVTTLDGLSISIPIHKALGPTGDVLLATAMNGQDLTPDHGYPVRLIVPGYVGVRNAKYVQSLSFTRQPVTSPWQSGLAYKGLSPNRVDLTGIDLTQVTSVQELPVNSQIIVPQAGETIPRNTALTIRGWAYSGGGRGIARVDVSIDGGANWLETKLTDGVEQPDHQSWAWTFWECEVNPELITDTSLSIVAKAVDVSYNSQPEHLSATWNLRGLVNNTWARCAVKVATGKNDTDG
jgi:sulfite oxidase